MPDSQILRQTEPNSDDTLEPDWGTVAPGSSADKRFRLLNESELYTATGVLITSTHIDLYLSTDGRNFGVVIAVEDIPPLSHSAIYWVRRITRRDALSGAYAGSTPVTIDAWMPAVTD